MKKPRIQKNILPLTAVLLTIFIDLLGVGILLPSILAMVTTGSASPILPPDWTVSQGLVLLGWLSAMYPIAQFFSAPIMGQLSDRYGRKPVLAASVFGTALGYLLFAVAILTTNIPLLFISRIIDGLTGGNYAVAQTVVADLSSTKDRARNFGLVGLVGSIGLVLGPYIGGRLADPTSVAWFSQVTPFWFVAALSILNGVLVLVFLPETLKSKISNPLSFVRPLRNLSFVVSRPALRSVMTMNFLFVAGSTLFMTFFGLILIKKFGFSAGEAGSYYAYLALCTAIVQGLAIGFVAKRFEDYQVLRASAFIAAAGLLAYAVIPASSYQWLWLIPPIIALGSGMVSAFGSSIMVRLSPKGRVGEVIGLNVSLMAIAQIIPAVLSGYVASISYYLPIISAAGLIALGGIVFWVSYRPGGKLKSN